MSTEILSESPRPVDVLNELIARYGLIRVILALPLALWQRRAGAQMLPSSIPAHLARDIGIVQESLRKTHLDYR